MNPHPLNFVLLDDICVASLDYAAAAERAGADRIELCSELECGGVTPGVRLMKAARGRLRIPIHVLIRPRAGDFVYSAREFSAMRTAIQKAKELKMDGIVVGVLDRDSRIDMARTRELVELAHPLPVTFHRAFDKTGCGADSLEAVIQTGAVRLLTSGGRATTADGLFTIARLVKRCRGPIERDAGWRDYSGECRSSGAGYFGARGAWIPAYACVAQGRRGR